MKEIIRKAEVLIDALPYIRNFYGKTLVIKYGGAAQTRDELKELFSQDIAMLNFIGIRTVIVHGGGPKISAIMEKMGKKPKFVHGQRVTDQETMDIVEMVLGGLVNKEIVSLINRHGGKAVGLSGKDGGLIRAQKKPIRKVTPEAGVSEIVDLGLVGEVTSIDPSILDGLERSGFIPVISPIGVGPEGETLNINADYVASAVASALKAEKLILLTDVAGLLDKKGTVISTLKKSRIAKLVKDGTISGGMLPKVQACMSALEQGVGKTHIVDGRVPHCLLLEIFTREGIGTEILSA
ncbi:MAG: acetylglutamate kinase [Nitrospirae bacterium]|nr:acetylglutamate kinase [Nitrospirota bacterium]